MAQGCASRTMISKARRYISRSARRDRRESLYFRLVSLLLQAKCFTVAAIFWDWMPSTMAPASFPVSRGSSEKYSKFRPHRGLRWMLTAGASQRSMLFSLTSAAAAAPTRETSSLSQVAASRVAQGQAVVHTPTSG